MVRSCGGIAYLLPNLPEHNTELACSVEWLMLHRNITTRLLQQSRSILLQR
jgi:hypothetical protein